MHRALVAVLCLSCFGTTTAHAVARPALDASAGASAPGAAGRLAAIASDRELAKIATISQTDARHGVPTFLWAVRTAPPATPGPARIAAQDMRGAAASHPASTSRA